MNRKYPPCDGANPRGFSLIEVLVALLVLSVGLLGLAGLQARGLKDNQLSVLHSQATLYATDIIDEMRVHRTQALNGDYNIGLNDGAGAKGATKIVLKDLQNWKADVARLPGGKGSVEVDGATGVVTVTLQWSEVNSVTRQEETTVYKVQSQL
jgi:type IV pilus assembly protein PilV